MRTKKSLQQIIYVPFLLLAVIILFQWYTTRNRQRIEEQNKNYAADAAQMKADQIDGELRNALNRITTYAYFVGESMEEPVITTQRLANMEGNMIFDALMYTDADGTDHASDGRTADARERFFYQNGMQGENGIGILFDPHFFNETMVCFYAPVYWQGEIVGVLRAAYLAEEYLQNMLAATYFGEAAEVYLCTQEGQVIASSNGRTYEGDLASGLAEEGVIDDNTAANVREDRKSTRLNSSHMA